MNERGQDVLDDRLDRRLGDLLATEAEDLGGAPTAEEMTIRVARRVSTVPVAAAGRPLGALRPAALLVALLALLVALLALVLAQRPDTRPLGGERMIVIDDRAIDPVTGGPVPGPCLACGPSGFPDASGRIRFASWSADGSRLAYVDTGSSIVVVDVRAGSVVPTGACAGCVAEEPTGIPPMGSISVSPGGREVAFSEDGRIRVVDVATGSVRDLATDPRAGPASAPAWSPDGRWVAYMVGSGGQRGGGGLWRVAADGTGTPQRIAEGSVGDPAWSPDGTTIAYLDRSPDRPGLWVVGVEGGNVDGGQPRRLTTDAGCFLSSGAPVWAPDGTSIAVGITSYGPDGSSCGLWLVDPSDTGREPAFLADGRGSHAAWRPDPTGIESARPGP
jgi:Tol biopolymer transport system component